VQAFKLLENIREAKVLQPVTAFGEITSCDTCADVLVILLVCKQ